MYLQSRACAHQSMHTKHYTTTFVDEFHALIRRVRLLLPSPTVVSHINRMRNHQETDRHANGQTSQSPSTKSDLLRLICMKGIRKYCLLTVNQHVFFFSCGRELLTVF